MVQLALIAAPIGAATAVAVATKTFLNTRQNSQKELRRGVVDENEASFACERVCASDRLMAKLGGLGKAELMHTCVTTCGMSATDACVDACARVACTAGHGVPGWNEKCLRRCARRMRAGKDVDAVIGSKGREETYGKGGNDVNYSVMRRESVRRARGGQRWA